MAERATGDRFAERRPPGTHPPLDAPAYREHRAAGAAPPPLRLPPAPTRPS